MVSVIRQLLPLVLLAVTVSVSAQRGLPPKEKTKIKHVTKYPQHLDFLPDMVKLLNVPDGWEVSVAASILGRPRMLHPAPDGALYVTRRDASDVLLLKDNDKDGKFDDVITIVSEFRAVHGITVKSGWLYLCGNNELRRYRMKPDGTVGEVQSLINDLPSAGQHPNRTIDFGPDGKLYITVGTLCNDCKEMDKEVAAVLQVDTTTWKRKVFATGLRNTIGFDWHPITGELWGLDNGADTKGNNWPPEEVNKIVLEGNYGYPFAYGNRDIDESKDDPPGETKEEWVKNTEPSMLDIQPHSAPIAFKFFRTAPGAGGIQAGDGLVCLHGSWNRNKPSGYKIQLIKFENGVPVRTEDFMTGFLKPGFLFFKRKARFGRPTGLTITQDGTIYMSDDANGVIYSIKRTTK